MQDNPTITYLSQPNLLRIDDLEIDVVIASTTCLLEEFGLSFKFQALDGLSLPGLSVELAIRDQEIKDSNVHIIGKHESLSLLGGTYLKSFSTHFAKQLRGRYNCLSIDPLAKGSIVWTTFCPFPGGLKKRRTREY